MTSHPCVRRSGASSPARPSPASASAAACRPASAWSSRSSAGRTGAGCWRSCMSSSTSAWRCRPSSAVSSAPEVNGLLATAREIRIGGCRACSYGLRRSPCAPRPAASGTVMDRIYGREEGAMSEFAAGDRVRNDNNSEGGTGTVLAWDDPRCPFAQQDWSGYTVVAWDDDTVTVIADGALSRAAGLDWDEEAEGPEA